MPVSHISVGNTGLTLSRIIPGLMRLREWNMTRDDLVNWIQACLDLSMTSFDHADIYGGYTCEAVFGEALAASPGLRDRMQLVTKCGIALINPNRPEHTVHHYITTTEHILQSVEASLRNFHTDHLDLLLIHRPDPLMDADEVAAALQQLKQSGKVLHFGVSNFMPFHFTLLQSRLDFPLVTNQIEFSVTHMDALFDGTLDQAQELRLPPMIWSPLGGGGLFTSQDERSKRVRTTLEQIGQEVGATADGVALAWIMAHPAKPLPVLGTGKIERIKIAAEAEGITLSREQWFAVWEASMGHDVP